MPGPLRGTKVLELAQIMAGPACGLMLADIGADVIKIEKIPEGDDSRKFLPPDVKGESAAFMIMNRGKRGLGLNLKDTSKFAFLLSIPTILGALILMFLKGAFLLELNDLLIILTGFFGSAFVAFFTIKSFLKFVEKIGMTPFVLYRVALGAVLLLL